MWSDQEIFENVAPLMVLKEDIYKHTAIRPTALMFPLSFLPEAETFSGLPIIRGDRFAVVFEPKKRSL